MNYLPLIGIVIILIGFTLKLDTTAMLILAAISTALAAGMDIVAAIEILGKNFVSSRQVTIFLLPLPMIAIVERYGLKEAAARLIRKLKGLTAPVFLFCYYIIRAIAVAISIPFGGHAQVVRPLVYPMAEAAMAKDGELSEEDVEKIKGRSAAMENTANFFSQNMMLGSSGVLLISKTLQELGYNAPSTEIVKNASIIAFCSAAVVFVFVTLWNKQAKKGGTK